MDTTSSRSWSAERPVLSGRLPPLADPYAPRQETGLSLVNLPPGQVTVLATADDAAPQRGPGPGGTGKTYLAASLARAHLADRAAYLVVWVTAASQDAVIRGYAQALGDVGMSAPAGGTERAAARFLEWLRDRFSQSAQFAGELAPAGLAGRALSLVSMLGPYGIPAAVLTCRAARTYLAGGGAFPIDRAQAWNAVQNLAAAGLVSIDADSAARTVLAHALVQAMARQNLPAAEREQAIRASADALAEIWSGQDTPPDVTLSLRDCAARLREVGGGTLWTPQCHPVLLRVGEGLTSSGLIDQAVAYWQAMLSISERHLGPGHAQTVQFRDLLGAAYEMSGRTDEVVAMYEDLLSHLEKTEATCHPDILAARTSLARGYLAVGRPADGPPPD
ncbi:MAG: hypothetical protein ACRDNF_11605 [Streptosporangiaceae bacterium]